VKTRSFGKFKIRSHSYHSPGAFEDRTETYFFLVRELCRRVHASNPEAQFLKGSGWIQTLWLIVLIVAALGWLFLALMLLGGADLEDSLTFFVLLALITSFSGRWIMRNKPELFDPLNPPLE
jgi:hypothetical protein